MANIENTKRIKQKKQKEARQPGFIMRMAKDNHRLLPLLSVVLLISIGAMLLEIVAPRVLGDAVNVLAVWLKEGGAFNSSELIRLVTLLAIVGAGAFLLQVLLRFMMCFSMSWYLTYGFRVRVSRTLLRLPVSFIDNMPFGEVLSRTMDDVSNLGGVMSTIIENMLTGAAKIIGIGIMMFIVNPYLALIVIVLMPVSIFTAALLSLLCAKHFKQMAKETGKLNAHIQESYSAHDVTKAYNLTDYNCKKFNEINEEIKKTSYKAFTLGGMIGPIISFVNNAGFVVLSILGAYLAIEGTIDVGDILTIILYAQMFGRPLEQLANTMSHLQRSKASANRIYEIYDSKQMSPEANENQSLTLNSEIKFENVNFSYSPEVALITNLNIKIKQGQKVAIVGPTGCGKTTLVNLLMRFYDVNSGDIIIDNNSVYGSSRNAVRDIYSMVLQDVWLFKGTIRENIMYGNEHATDEQIDEACCLAHVDHFIKTLPKGYDTEINEDATNISQGQKQLITIARAYLAHRPVLILDEATSNVDTLTELLVQQAMAQLMQDRTSFVIAHRLSTIVDSDLILVMRDGQIIEQGTHETLIEANGFYAELYNSQFAA